MKALFYAVRYILIVVVIVSIICGAAILIVNYPIILLAFMVMLLVALGYEDYRHKRKNHEHQQWPD